MRTVHAANILGGVIALYPAHPVDAILQIPSAHDRNLTRLAAMLA